MDSPKSNHKSHHIPTRTRYIIYPMDTSTDRQVAAAVLSKRYEEQLFSQASRHGRGEPIAASHTLTTVLTTTNYPAHLHAPTNAPTLSLHCCVAVVPVLVITGFLGSGKTTLLQHLLASSG